MTSDVRRIRFATRERLLSTDLNDATDLLIRTILSSITALSTPDEFGLVQDNYGVISGLLVSATGLNKRVRIEEGLAIKFDPSNAGQYDSQYRLIEVNEAGIDVDLTSYIDPAQPRWVCVEIAPGSTIETASLRDIFNPTVGTFVPQTVEKVRTSLPIATVVAGTPSAYPSFPAGTPGKIPLAYVHLPAAAATVDPRRIIRCRPIFNNRFGDSSSNILGGGMEAYSGSSQVSTATAATFKPGFCAFPLAIDLKSVGTFVDIAAASAPNFVTGATYPPVSRTPIYVYLISAPYPAGYDTNLAVREFKPADEVIAASLIRSFQPGMTNGILAFSYDPPLPVSANIGTNLGLVLSGVNDPVWANGPGANFLQQMRVAYIGALSHSGVTLHPQRCKDGDRIVFTDGSAASGTVTRNVGTSNTNTLGNFTFANVLTFVGGQWAPTTISAVQVLFGVTSAGANSNYSLSLASDDTTSANWAQDSRPIGGASVNRLALLLATTGAFRYSCNNTLGGSALTLDFSVQGYVDGMLHRR